MSQRCQLIAANSYLQLGDLALLISQRSLQLPDLLLGSLESNRDAEHHDNRKPEIHDSLQVDRHISMREHPKDPN